MAGVRGRRRREVVAAIARGRVDWVEGSRHGVIPAVLLGDVVKVIAYDRRR